MTFVAEEATWQKPDPGLVECFAASLPDAPGVEQRKMFGCPCAFVNGNMFAGVHEQRVILRLPQAVRERLCTAGAGKPFAVMGRTMREYVAIEDAVGQPQGRLSAWLQEAFSFAASLPPKAARTRTRSAAKVARTGRAASRT